MGCSPYTESGEYDIGQEGKGHSPPFRILYPLAEPLGSGANFCDQYSAR